MCGLVGILDPRMGTSPEALAERASRMADRIVHRGPDAGGRWADPDGGAALGHRRLAILDLSEEGAQPMASEDGRFVIAFNGEIYNFKAIREQLEKAGRRFRGHSDTEVMLSAFSQWGVRESVTRFAGMFAFAVWDRVRRVLTLGRDRLGEKPLYYGWIGGQFVFASELKAFKAHPAWAGEVDRQSLAHLLHRSYIPAPLSIFKGFSKLLPGTLLEIPPACAPGREPAPEPYWNLRSAIDAAAGRPFRGDDKEAEVEFERLLSGVIGEQMISDVPLGAFLSGGIDSSLVVAVMQGLSSKPVRTFTIGFHEKGFDEAVHARSVAAHLGTDHTEMYVSPREAMDVIPRLPQIYDEPFADVSQIPTCLVSALTRKHVTVCLSGDGGDELLGGYTRYLVGRKLWRGFRYIPRPVRAGVGRFIGAIPPASLGAGLGMVSGILPPSLRQNHAADKLLKFTEILPARKADDIYASLVSFWKTPAQLVLGSGAPAVAGIRSGGGPALCDFTDRMMYTDAVTYLPDDIMVKVDRAAMAASLESRAPYLDHRLVEFAWSLPRGMKIRDGQGKWLLRQALYKRVPRALLDRPKMGFGVPVESWLRGPLRDWGENLLQERKLREQGYLEPEIVLRKWREHQKGLRNWHYHLWIVLMFQAWLEAQA